MQVDALKIFTGSPVLENCSTPRWPISTFEFEMEIDSILRTIKTDSSLPTKSTKYEEQVKLWALDFVLRSFDAGLRDIILRNTDIQTLPQNIFVSNPEQPWPLAETQSVTSPEGVTAAPAETSVSAAETLRSGVYEIEWEPETMNGEEYLKFKLMCENDGWVGLGIAEGISRLEKSLIESRACRFFQCNGQGRYHHRTVL